MHAKKGCEVRESLAEGCRGRSILKKRGGRQGLGYFQCARYPAMCRLFHPPALTARVVWSTAASRCSVHACLARHSTHCTLAQHPPSRTTSSPPCDTSRSPKSQRGTTMTIGRGHDLPHAGPSHLGFAPRLPERVERAAERAERAERERHDRFDNPDRAHPTHSASAPGSASASSPASSASAAMHRRPTNPSYGAPLSALLPLLQRGGRNGHAGHSHTTFASHAHTHNGHREMNPYARPITHPRHPSATASATPASPAGPSTSAGGTPTASGSASGSRPVQRSRNGCYTCRKRKVKCDERTPICIKCEYSGRGCEWPPEDPVIRRKNRPRKMKLHLVSDSKPASSPPAAPPAPPPPLTEDAKRTLRVPIHALQAFAATLPKLPRDRGYDTGPAGIAGTMTGMQGLKGLKGMGERMMPRRLRAGLMTDAAFLAPYFPQVDERLIFRHFVHHTAPLGLARDDPDPKRTWNPWVSLLAPLAFVHLPG